MAPKKSPAYNAQRKPTKAAPKKAAKPLAKPSAKPAAKAVAKPISKSAIKPVTKPVAATAAKSKVTVWPAGTSAEAHAHHHHGDCCGHDHTPKASFCGCLTECCPIARVLCTRAFWAASVAAFFVIFATDWLLHTRFLMNDYATTSALWRADGEIRHELIFAAQALTAMAYAAIIISIGSAGKWWGSFSSGLLAASPVAISALTSYIMLPFASPYIPAVWAAASLAQGALAGLAICAILRLSRAPGCCPPKPVAPTHLH